MVWDSVAIKVAIGATVVLRVQSFMTTVADRRVRVHLHRFHVRRSMAFVYNAALHIHRRRLLVKAR